MQSKIKYQFSAKLWKHSSVGGWYFVTMPKHLSSEIRNNLKWQEEGWGRMKSAVFIKDLNWNTSIWFDSKVNRYVLPVKLEIRKKLNLKENDLLDVIILV